MLKDPSVLVPSEDYLHKVLDKITLKEFLQLELLCGRFLSLYEKHPKNCVTKVGKGKWVFYSR